MKLRADGRYQKQITVSLPNGEKKHVIIYGKSVAEINRKMLDAKDRYLKGRRFDRIASEWWDIHSESLAPNSLKNYKPAFDRAYEAFGKMKMAEITSAKISAFLSSLPFADKTLRNQLMIINQICIYAVSKGELTYNPAEYVKIPRNLPKEKVSAPDREEIDKVINSVDDEFGFFPFLALHTGMRRGELLCLEWSDFHNGVITVDKSLYWQYGKAFIKKPKTKAGIRQIPIMDAVKPYIKHKKGLVFSDLDGNYLSEGSFQNKIKQYKKRTGVSCTIHQLRHAFATLLYENGIDAKDAQQLLGHSQISTTLDIYTDISEARKNKVFKKLRKISFL